MFTRELQGLCCVEGSETSSETSARPRPLPRASRGGAASRGRASRGGAASPQASETSSETSSESPARPRPLPRASRGGASACRRLALSPSPTSRRMTESHGGGDEGGCLCPCPCPLWSCCASSSSSSSCPSSPSCPSCSSSPSYCCRRAPCRRATQAGALATRRGQAAAMAVRAVPALRQRQQRGRKRDPWAPGTL